MNALIGFLRDLQGAATATQLYPREHPRLVALITSALRQAETVATGGEASVMSVDGRLVVDNRVVPGNDQLLGGIFAILARSGYHRITLRPGTTADELYAFANRLAQARLASAGDAILQSSEHIRLASLEVVHAGPAQEAGDGDLSPSVQALENVWGSILDSRRCDVDAMEFVVVALARMIEKQASGMIPLAALRHHDDYTLMHITNVALLAMALSEAIGLPAQTINDIGTAALLHDVGKLRVPAEILNAPGRLTQEQAAVVRRHPEEGARVLLATPGASDLAVIVAFEHHIQFDGGGYPMVPRSWKLNLASAITTIADVYDALRSDRPYRRGLDRDKIKSIMLKDAGTVFDPELVRIFFECVAPRTFAADGAPVTTTATVPRPTEPGSAAELANAAP